MRFEAANVFAARLIASKSKAGPPDAQTASPRDSYRMPLDELSLLDWKRRIFALYAAVREDADHRHGWQHWREVRDELFRTHPQSPLADDARASFRGLPYFDYDPSFRVVATVAPAEPVLREIATSGERPYTFRRFARATFELGGEERSLALFWLEGYGGGVFLSFADATSGRETYGACRYLLDTVKGSDLGEEAGGVVLDFNFAYNPSCAYDPRWVCPLAPPENRLRLAITAGERY
jgi:uncharacterized protein (DUF1684 family)